MKNINPCKTFIVLALSFFCFSVQSNAQLILTAQIRPRAEYRDGVVSLVPKDQVAGNNDTSAAGLISERFHLALFYKFEKVSMGLSIQDVRVWGQDASNINAADGAKLGIHEAWAEVILSVSIGLSLKAGRQELLYDDSGLLGNVDWLQFNTFNTFYTAGNTPQYVSVKRQAPFSTFRRHETAGGYRPCFCNQPFDSLTRRAFCRTRCLDKRHNAHRIVEIMELG
jgi:hypothetical protein